MTTTRGIPGIAGARCFGYTPAGDLVGSEAQVIRTIVDSVLAGATLKSQVEALNRESVATAGGGHWQISSLVRLLTNPRLAGLTNRRDGKPYRAIITEAEHRELAAQAQARRSTRRNPSSRQGGWLLSGLVECGACHGPMWAHSNAHRGRSYRCHNTGCGRYQIQAEPLEAYAAERAIAALGDPSRPPLVVEAPAAVLRRRMQGLDEYRASLDVARAERAISDAEFEAARKRLKQRRALLRAKITEAEQVAPPAPHGDPARWWASASVEARRAVLASLWDSVVVGAPTAHVIAGLDTGRVQLVPRQAVQRAS